MHMENNIHDIIISLHFRKKNAVFRVINEVTKIWENLGRQISDTVPSEQFSTHFCCMLCCHTVNSKAYNADAINPEFRQKLYEMLIFTEDCTSHGLPDGPLYLKNNVLDMKLLP